MRTITSKLSIPWLLSYISIASVSAVIITPALPEIEHAFALNTAAIEWVVSAFLIGYVLGQLIYGPLANVYGRLKALQWGLNINILGVLFCLFASFYANYPLLLIGRLITGLGSAAGLTCTFMLINEWLPEEQRKTATAYSILSFALGIGFAVLLGGIITQYSHWQGCFIFLLLQGLLMRVGIRVFDETLIEAKSFHIPTLLRDYGQALFSFKLLVFSLIWGVCSAVGYCYSAAAPQIAHHYLNLTASEYGYWNIINIIGMLSGGISARFLMQRFRTMQVIAMGYIACSLALLSLGFMLYLNHCTSLWFFTSTSLLYCFSSYLYIGGSYIASNAIEDKASASSMMSFLSMSVATLSVVVMGYLSANPFYGFLSILSGLLLLTLLLLICYQMRIRKNRHAPHS
ncbi:MFS transporter [Legionella sp. 27cVA30]|uniref:MFS transporter n=1 Tax=Legionella TaxID=445 RepID=UPI000F8D7FA3|nr:MFS transporter [Legionella septentrionalis]MCP0913760.1 MFS transporter [Legionella sp. 27cVA30]RUR14540.1 MFS transporter [Legionella septentrionalis]